MMGLITTTPRAPWPYDAVGHSVEDEGDIYDAQEDVDYGQDKSGDGERKATFAAGVRHQDTTDEEGDAEAPSKLALTCTLFHIN